MLAAITTKTKTAIITFRFIATNEFQTSLLVFLETEN